MKAKKKNGKYSDKEWRELSSLLSDEKMEKSDILSHFEAVDKYNTIKYWKEIGEMSNEKEINVDRAWNKLYSRIKESGDEPATLTLKKSFSAGMILKIAAVVVLAVGLASALFYIYNDSSFLRVNTIATNNEQKNLLVSLPDGSTVYLNRNTRLSYNTNYGKGERNVKLTGEAFFEITPDASRPFVVSTGKARVKVLGTSFNVISDIDNYSVEVYVKTGKVLLSDNTGTQNIVLDPGFIGKLDSDIPEKSLNDDPNYLSWNTGLLVYDGQTLDVVFRDLKRVYNMDIVADDPGILENPWTSPINNQPQETIIRLICTSFNLNYVKDGSIYHLSEK